VILRNARDLRPLLRSLGAHLRSPGAAAAEFGAIDPAEVETSGEAHPDGPVVDLEGRWVIPGLWDHHVHFGQWAMASRRLDLAGAGSAVEAASLVREHVAAHPPAPGTVYLASGFRDGLWADAPSPELIEVGEVPIALLSADVHTLWLNAAAVRFLGLPASDWWLREQPAFDATRRITEVPADVLDGWAVDAAREAATRGVTGIVDFEMADAPGSWARRFGAGFRGLRVRAAAYPHQAWPLPESPSPLLETGPFKLFTDGSLNTRTAWCYDEYPGSAGAGLPTYAPGELLAAARDGVARGLAPHIHAIGDRAVTEAIDVFEQLGVPGTIEHVQLIRDDDVPRLARLGLTASVQPEHAMDDRDVAERYWAGRTGRAFALRTLQDAGVRLAFGSDAPVAPLDPWITMAAAVTRTRDGRAPWHPEQALTPLEALAASTHDHPGDLVVLDADPLDPANLREMPVHATLVAGEWTFGPYA
jgi:Predicted metal-dependent hydrolase with the TIM-barrel fold